ncbi:arsenic transporter [Mycetocola tolaasinivorans]|uniref:Arsenic transporter n=1 Tax=Mycetocola tolaasinivorans TaxID=76635 RepID=A0A3L7AD49_9MICO|nr:arsenic transporter [Mycetocola tolaasinivorans]RLP77904.1 arsenic transporter [Mycetocola tolaasinivorans]
MTIIAIAIFVITLVLVIWQPRGLGIGWSALGGAGLALITTVVSLGDIPTVWDIVGNATFAFVGIVLISLILDESGLFEWAALHVTRWGCGNGRLLFVMVILLGAVISALFANDGAALILTPIVIQILIALKFSARASLGFVLACGFVADAGSLPLVISNLVNIVSADYFGIDFARYAIVMVPVGIVTVAASLGVLYLAFRRSIPRRYDPAAAPDPRSAIHDPLTFTAGFWVLGVLLIGYFVADPLHIPLSVITAVGALALILIAARRPAFLFTRATPLGSNGDATVRAVSEDSSATVGLRRISVRRVVREAPWQIVLFSIGMYLVVYGLRNQGLTDRLAGVFAGIGQNGVLVTALGVGVIVAVLASIMNNLPTVLIAALAIGAAGATGLTHEAMIYANVIGSDLGPKITPIGSLATLLWLHVLDRRGIHIGWGRYFRTGILLTVPVLLISLSALAGWLLIIG